MFPFFVTLLQDFRIISMKTIYMEATLNIMPRTEVEELLKNETVVKELPGDIRYLIVTKPKK